MKVAIDIKDNKTCSVVSGDYVWHSVHGLTAEQATAVKDLAEMAYRTGKRDGLCEAVGAIGKLQRDLDNASQR